MPISLLCAFNLLLVALEENLKVFCRKQSPFGRGPFLYLLANFIVQPNYDSFLRHRYNKNGQGTPPLGGVNNVFALFLHCLLVPKIGG